MNDLKHIGFHIRIVSILINRYRDRLNESNPVERLTGTQGWVQRYLYEHQNVDVFQRDLENVFSVRGATMTNMLKLMEKNGFITRESVPHDARLKKIVLTQKAIENHERVMQNVRTMEDVVSKNLTNEEISEFIRIIQKIEKTLENETNPMEESYDQTSRTMHPGI